MGVEEEVIVSTFFIGVLVGLLLAILFMLY